MLSHDIYIRESNAITFKFLLNFCVTKKFTLVKVLQEFQVSSLLCKSTNYIYSGLFDHAALCCSGGGKLLTVVLGENRQPWVQRNCWLLLIQGRSSSFSASCGAILNFEKFYPDVGWRWLPILSLTLEQNFKEQLKRCAQNFGWVPG